MEGSSGGLPLQRRRRDPFHGLVPVTIQVSVWLKAVLRWCRDAPPRVLPLKKPLVFGRSFTPEPLSCASPIFAAVIFCL